MGNVYRGSLPDDVVEMVEGFFDDFEVGPKQKKVFWKQVSGGYRSMKSHYRTWPYKAKQRLVRMMGKRNESPRDELWYRLGRIVWEHVQTTSDQD